MLKIAKNTKIGANKDCSGSGKRGSSFTSLCYFTISSVIYFSFLLFFHIYFSFRSKLNR